MIRIGIIGAGNFSSRHIEAIHQIPTIEIKAVCRRDPLALAMLTDKYKLVGKTDYRQLINNRDIDAVLIATPHHLHTQIAIEAAGAGKHVLLEKPMASTYADCKAINDACNQSGVVLMIGQVAQFSPGFKVAKKCIDSGEIGEIQMVKATSISFWKHGDRKDWHLKKISGGGYLLTVAIHQLDALCALVPAEVTSVFASMTNAFHGDEVDDGGLIFLGFKNGQKASLHYTGFKDGVNEISIDINGSKGSLRLDNTKGAFLGRDQKYQLLPGSFSRDWMNEGLVNQWKEFSEAILNGREPMASGNRTLKVMEVLFAAFESASSGKTIKLN
ncbi:Gfo/Idh/MocA family protein [Cyclobacterium marinum]|uniref:Oxidoreductase domain protein n=1 Tax=Cyclobacterium marinum (strain ATCC 25205 / DSM 745 / LMG 13164 / NCIMB 1802) TaxID=880070 RepID=G0IUW2_CYCMS|nr:Gfo/Idh/MocA family oxidoreductase [Cyclobacterium marinum]AEL26186.1 oxidoreductase domain protein [Cyclobacterium marinum DSM 745]